MTRIARLISMILLALAPLLPLQAMAQVVGLATGHASVGMWADQEAQSAGEGTDTHPTIEYAYDALGRRVGKTTGGNTTIYVSRKRVVKRVVVKRVGSETSGVRNEWGQTVS